MSVRPAEANMPILNRLSRNLSPLEEDVASSKDVGPKPLRLTDRQTTSLVNDLISLILQARSAALSPSNTPKSRVEALGCQKSFYEVQRLPLCIEVRGQAKGAGPGGGSPLLLEQWNIRVLSKRPPSMTPPSSPQLLLQAVHSHLHFSQVRSWQEVGRKDHTPLPFTLLCRLCTPVESSDDFTPFPANYHTFPCVSLSPHAYLVVTVATLPRLPGLPDQLSPPCSRMVNRTTDNSHSTTDNSIRTTDTSNGAKGKSNSTTDNSNSATDNLIRTTDNSNSTTDKSHRTTDISNGKSNSTTDNSNSTTDNSVLNGANHQAASVPMPLSVGRLSKDSTKDGFPFSPPQPSPLSPKLLMGLADRTTVDPSDRGVACGDRGVALLERTLQRVSLKTSPTPVPVPADSASSNGGGGAVPPAACSPAPFSRMHASREKDGVKRRSCAIACKRPSTRAPPKRCNSAPVFVPSLCLLGTFEESVLNGRLEPCGYVDGFTVEVGASGSFCPPHAVLPVNAEFYSLHDNHGGTSPYLGQVDLSGVGKKGYQVPRKGTVQVTLFNPNHTVVKMYIVTYDFSDMPALTQTFLRQKTLSHPTKQGALPSLHYLIHLRFLCSKSKRIYLHRDIRLIFARRAPDTDPDSSKVTLSTVTEGPLEPKYSPCS